MLLLHVSLYLTLIGNKLFYIMNISDHTRMIQWNCCSIRGKLPQLQSITNEFDVMYIQESLLWLHNSFWINRFKIIRKDFTSSNQRGICTLVRENLIFSVIDLSAFNHLSLEMLGIKLTVDNEPLVIINIYRHPNQITPFVMFNQLFSTLLNTYNKVIFVGDFNAHHPWWGCEYEDSADKSLSRIIEDHNLVTLNDRLSTILLHPNATRVLV